MDYATHIFDCDGVLLASNAAKARAFYAVTVHSYGEANARALEAYHKVAGSIGRQARFRHFFSEILKRSPEPGEIETLMARCTDRIITSTLQAGLVNGAWDYLHSLDFEKCIVVSGIEQTELEYLLHRYGLADCFLSIYGGPKSKGEILDAISAQIIPPAVIYGDAEEDYLCAVSIEADFILVKSDSFWSDGPDTIADDSRARTIEDFTELLVPAGSKS